MSMNFFDIEAMPSSISVPVAPPELPTSWPLIASAPATARFHLLARNGKQHLALWLLLARLYLAGDGRHLGLERLESGFGRAQHCVPENSQDPSQPIRPIIGPDYRGRAYSQSDRRSRRACSKTGHGQVTDDNRVDFRSRQAYMAGRKSQPHPPPTACRVERPGGLPCPTQKTTMYAATCSIG